MQTTLSSEPDTAASSFPPPAEERLATFHVGQGEGSSFPLPAGEDKGEGASSPRPLGEGKGEGRLPHLSLDRYPGETPRALAAFTAFFTLGQRRSLQAVASKLDLGIDTIKKWSSRHDWQSRVIKLDATVHQQEADLHVAAEREAAADWLQRLETFREQEWDAAQKLLSAARCYLETFGEEDLSRMTLAQVSRALRISSQIGRLALAGAEPPPTPEAATTSPIQQQLLESLARLSAHKNVNPAAAVANGPGPVGSQLSTINPCHVPRGSTS